MGQAICSLNNERRTGQHHPVGLEHPLERLLLIFGISLVNRLLRRRKLFELGQSLKKLLDLAALVYAGFSSAISS